MSDFAPAAVSFTDDAAPDAPARQALLHHPALDVASARELLDGAGAHDWPAFSIEHQPGRVRHPKGNIPVSGSPPCRSRSLTAG
jgi:hypothetical protein